MRRYLASMSSSLNAEVTRGMRAGWRWLAMFWGVILAALLAGLLTLQLLGPPSEAQPDTSLAAPEPAATLTQTPAPTHAVVAALPAASPGAAPMPVTIQAFVEAGLVEPSADGPLPRVAPDGRSPMQAYARPFDAREARPRLAIVLGGLGMNTALAEQATASLPPAIGLAFSPYATAAPAMILRARARGFETLLALPMEPTGYPLNDPGERALLTGLPPGENAARLDWLLARFPGHAGVIGALGPLRGERFANLAAPYEAMQSTLARRGLYFLDARPGAPAPARAVGRSLDAVLDEGTSRAEFDQRLAALERLARERGAALGYVGEATPVALARLGDWAAGLESRGVVLAPPSALVRPAGNRP